MNSPVSWDLMRGFLMVLEEGSLSGAARRMGVAQPTVRAAIEALEAALQTVLFTRSVKGLVPTEQARALGASARAMARASEAFIREAAGTPGAVTGVVRLSVSELVGVAVIPPILADLRVRYPELAVELVLSNLSANLLEQEVDVAVRMSPPRQEALVARKVAAIPLGLFAHAAYLRRRGQPAALADLAAHDLIGPDRSLADWAAVDHLLPGFDRRRFVLRTDSHPAQLEAARAGIGIAVVQRPIGMADPLLCPVLPQFDAGTLDTWIVTHENLRDVPRIRALFDHLSQAFQNFAH